MVAPLLEQRYCVACRWKTCLAFRLRAHSNQLENSLKSINLKKNSCKRKRFSGSMQLTEDCPSIDITAQTGVQGHGRVLRRRKEKEKKYYNLTKFESLPCSQIFHTQHLISPGHRKVIIHRFQLIYRPTSLYIHKLHYGSTQTISSRRC